MNSSLQGKSGNPLGRLPGEKQFTDQLRLVLAEPVDRKDPQSVRKMRRIVEKLAECAMNGEGWAICQVADRLDGKRLRLAALQLRLQIAETCINAVPRPDGVVSQPSV